MFHCVCVCVCDSVWCTGWHEYCTNTDWVKISGIKLKYNFILSKKNSLSKLRALRMKKHDSLI